MSRKECGNTEGEYVLCPLFVAFLPTEIKCRSHVPDAIGISLRYLKKEDCDQQRKIFCEGCWSRCEHYRSWKHMQWEDED